MGLRFFKWRSAGAERGHTQQEQLRKWNKHDLVIVSTPGCDASRRIAYRLLEANSIPDLPVPGCKNRYCTCELEQFPSRRVGADRRSGHDQRAKIRLSGERRIGPDRRKRGVDVWKKNRYR